MIYTLAVVACKEAKSYNGGLCVRVIEIEEGSSLDDLHVIIQDVTGYARNVPYDFYEGRSLHHKDLRIGKTRYGGFIPDAFSRIRLNEVYPLAPGLQLYYAFDSQEGLIFRIEKSRQLKEELLGTYYPREIAKQG